MDQTWSIFWLVFCFNWQKSPCFQRHKWTCNNFEISSLGNEHETTFLLVSICSKRSSIYNLQHTIIIHFFGKLVQIWNGPIMVLYFDINCFILDTVSSNQIRASVGGICFKTKIRGGRGYFSVIFTLESCAPNTSHTQSSFDQQIYPVLLVGRSSLSKQFW